MAAPPPQTPDRLAENLAKAGAMRAARAVLKADLKSGQVSLRHVLESPDEVAQKLKVVALLESLPGVGKVKARRAMSDIGIADTRRVQGLGSHQRQALLDQFGDER